MVQEIELSNVEYIAIILMQVLLLFTNKTVIEQNRCHQQSSHNKGNYSKNIIYDKV